MPYIPRCPICGDILEDTALGVVCRRCGYDAELEVHDRAVSDERSFDVWIERDEDEEL